MNPTSFIPIQEARMCLSPSHTLGFRNNLELGFKQGTAESSCPSYPPNTGSLRLHPQAPQDRTHPAPAQHLPPLSQWILLPPVIPMDSAVPTSTEQRTNSMTLVRRSCKTTLLHLRASHLPGARHCLQQPQPEPGTAPSARSCSRTW